MLRFITFALLICTYIAPLSAFSVGREGLFYVRDGIKWQNVCYEEDDAGFTGSLPGSPMCGIGSGLVYCWSNYNGVDYEFHTSLDERYSPHKKEKYFIDQLYEAFGTEASIIPVSANQKKVKYCADIILNDGSKIIRIFCSKNCLYWALVEGADLSLAPLVFDSFKVTK